MSETAVGTVQADAGLTRGRRVPLLVVVALIVMCVVVLCAAVGASIAPYDPNAQDLGVGLSGSSASHLLGTDDLGRDILSRIIEGARTALVGPILVAVGAMLIGSALGLTAGYRGGIVDFLIMRWVDLMFSLPGLLVVVVVAGILGGGYLLAVATLVVLFSPVDTRVVRGVTLEQRNLGYVEAARTLGVPARTIMVRHIWLNASPVVAANTFLTFAFAIVTLSALSFLGIGVDPGTPDWGRMLSENRVLLHGNPLAAVAPGLMIILTAASMNVIGDWTYDRLAERGRAR
jgi:peptide/nickel transport system permease protein